MVGENCTNTNTNTNNLFTSKWIQQNIVSKYKIDNNNNNGLTVTNAGGRTNSRSCFHLSAQEPTGSSGKEQRRQNYIRAFTGYDSCVGRQF